MNGIELIADERERQLYEKGFDAKHDSKHSNAELTHAAVCYAINPAMREVLFNHKIPELWPFADKLYKPNPLNRVRELQKAGALIAAEIDRLLMAKKKV
ncbi:hypothetical protein ES705_29056 [subsurface metagenome]